MKTNYWFNQNRLRSHLRRSFWALAIVGASLTLPSAEAGSPIQSAIGQFFPCFTFAGPPRQVGENTIITFTIGGTANGTFNGSVAGSELDVVHHDGSITLEGSFLFTGSVVGKPGTGTMLFTYTGIGNVNTHSETLHFVGTQGTEGLAGVYFEGTGQGVVGGQCAGDFGGQGNYSGQILFAP